MTLKKNHYCYFSLTFSNILLSGKRSAFFQLPLQPLKKHCPIQQIWGLPCRGTGSWWEETLSKSPLLQSSNLKDHQNSFHTTVDALPDATTTFTVTCEEGQAPACDAQREGPGGLQSPVCPSGCTLQQPWTRWRLSPLHRPHSGNVPEVAQWFYQDTWTWSKKGIGLSG